MKRIQVVVQRAQGRKEQAAGRVSDAGSCQFGERETGRCAAVAAGGQLAKLTVATVY